MSRQTALARASVADPGFAGLLATQALGAFNDNAFKTFVALLAVATMPPERASSLIAAAGALFILPFLLFSTLAGTVCDRWSKKRLIVVFKGVELVLLLMSFPALRAGSVPGLCALLFLMGAHSAFFGPVKLAILPEILEDKDLSQGNGLMQLTTFAGIILGTVAAGLMLQWFRSAPQLACLVFIAAAALGLATSFLVPDVPAAGSSEPLRFNVAAKAWENIRVLRGLPEVFLATVGSAYFWFIGAIFQMNLLMYGKSLMGVDETMSSYFQIVIAAGIGLGGFLAGRISRQQVELGLVPLGALGLVLFSLDLAFSFRSTPRTVVDLLLAGAAAGCFVVPLQAFIQQRTPREMRGTVIATGNILTFAAILIASAWLWLYSDLFKLHPGQVFLATAVMTLVVAAWIAAKLSDRFIRLLLYVPVNLIYRILVVGRENVPVSGPCLFVSNHMSFIDAFLIGMANQRPVRFLMFRTYYDMPVVGWFFRAMGCIPISDRDGPKALILSFRQAQDCLKSGEVVCIFAEGEISRHGQMLRFKKGLERIVEGLDVPIVPVHLDQVWGSVFSFEGGRLLFKRPHRIPYPVTVSFGKPLACAASPFEVRQAIQELGSEAFSERLRRTPPPALAFARQAKSAPWRFAMADSSGRALNYGRAFIEAWALGKTLEELLGKEKPVGLLLPPSCGAALANIALAMHGRLPVNLNYTLAQETAGDCAARAGAKKILTSRKFLEKIGWKEGPEHLFIEDAAKRVSRLFSALAGLLWLVLPSYLAERLFLGKARSSLDDLATIMFTSGSMGRPKGVMLSHANILSNVAAMGQLYPLKGGDRILGALPFFHSFGFTVTLWFPFLCGAAAVYHYNPLDAKRLGELAERHKATFLLATPTFLQSYLKRVEPAQFKTLRYAIVGAEKLRAEVALAFKEKFGVTPMEGFGCTELSPVAAVNIADIDWPGHKQTGTKAGTVGHPLPGVFMKIVDPESGRALPAGEAGLLLVKGPNVMKGYLGDEEKTREVLRDGYYVTGDIASIDLDGFVTITDRLSRFSKIGGEMVPHVKVEETLHELAGLLEQTFVVTSVPDEKRGERLVVLCKGYAEVPLLCRKLQESTLPKLWIPDKDSFHAVPEFPLLGTGKLDLQRLKAEAKRLEGLST
jgi:acyl-[acyl-carrier-protein]-phospholipid O-acyltransferase/long-chain-fatty-acid--[acyl-carrier-protein] ligase